MSGFSVNDSDGVVPSWAFFIFSSAAWLHAPIGHGSRENGNVSGQRIFRRLQHVLARFQHA